RPPQQPEQEPAPAHLLDPPGHRFGRGFRLRRSGRVMATGLRELTDPGHQPGGPHHEPGPDPGQGHEQKGPLQLRLAASDVHHEQPKGRERGCPECDRDDEAGAPHVFDPVSLITTSSSPNPMTTATNPSATAPTRPSWKPPRSPCSRSHSM